MKLPLSDDELQRLIDEANPLKIPELVDALSRCQNALADIKATADDSEMSRVDRLTFPRWVSNVISQILK